MIDHLDGHISGENVTYKYLDCVFGTTSLKLRTIWQLLSDYHIFRVASMATKMFVCSKCELGSTSWSKWWPKKTTKAITCPYCCEWVLTVQLHHNTRHMGGGGRIIKKHSTKPWLWPRHSLTTPPCSCPLLFVCSSWCNCTTIDAT